MGFWIGIALILLAALGVVTGMQRRSEFIRRLDSARSKQRALADTLMKLQRETDFADSYESGEARELAESARSQTARLSSQFSQATRRLDSFKGWTTLFPAMESYVGIAKVLEDYEAVEHGVEQLQGELKRLDSILRSAKEESGGLANQWKDVKEHIVRLVGSDLPPSWQREFQQIDGELTRLSISTDPVQRAQALQRLKSQVQGWKRDISKISTWSEWKSQAGNRRPIMEATVGRLEKIGAEQAKACIEMKAALNNLQHLEALTPDELRQPGNEHFFELLGPSFTGLLNRSSVLLSLIADKARLEAALQRQQERLQSLYYRFSEPDYASKEKVVTDMDGSWFTDYLNRKHRLDSEIQSVLAAPQADMTPSAKLLSVDEQLFLGEQVSNLQTELESHYAHLQQVDATYDARLKVLADRMSDGLAKLASANLMQSDEYVKLNRWQEELHRLQSLDVPAMDDVERLEERIKDEWKVIEAAVKSRSSIDEGLQEHLDRLVRRHHDGPIESPYEIPHGQTHGRRGGFNQGPWNQGAFNTEGLAWTSLILAEEALASASWSVDDDWF